MQVAFHYLYDSTNTESVLSYCEYNEGDSGEPQCPKIQMQTQSCKAQQLQGV